MDDCTDLSPSMLGKSIKSISLLIKTFNKRSYMINFGIDDWTKSILTSLIAWSSVSALQNFS